MATVVADVSKKPWGLLNLPPLPAAALRVLQVIGNDYTGMKELVSVIRSDIALSSSILTLANSALFGLRTEISSILQAAALLGLDRVRAIALTVSLRSTLSDTLEIPGLLACWRHSLACAVLCEDLAPACFLERDEAYVAGLLHDIGRLALTVVEPLQYSNLILQAQEAPIDVRAVEREMFGTDHCEAGRWMVQQWKLPAQFAEIAAHHHDPVRTDRFGVPELVQVACQLADCLGFSAVLPTHPFSFEDLLARLPASAQKRLVVSQAELAYKVAKRISAVE